MRKFQVFLSSTNILKLCERFWQPCFDIPLIVVVVNLGVYCFRVFYGILIDLSISMTVPELKGDPVSIQTWEVLAIST